MAQPAANLFTQFVLTKEEEEAGIEFTTCQRMYIQNLISEAALEKVKLTFDPQNPQQFVQREAELQGQINVLVSLLNAYEDHLALNYTEVN